MSKIAKKRMHRLGERIKCRTCEQLQAESHAFEGRGGTSAEAKPCGFTPGFRNREDGHIYRAAFASGLPSPTHVADGLPASLIVRRNAAGAVVAIKATVEAGFIRAGIFYTREEASALMALESRDCAA